MMLFTRRLCLTTSETVEAANITYNTFRAILIKLHLTRVSRRANNILYYCDTEQKYSHTIT